MLEQLTPSMDVRVEVSAFVDNALRRTIMFLFLWFALSAVVLFFYAQSPSCPTEQKCQISGNILFTSGMLLALATASLGGLLGFLFGIPRTLRSNGAGPKDPSDSLLVNERSATQTVNTNLEDISDWLTKILVGAGLVQLTSLGNALESIGSQFQGDLGSKLVALTIIINFTVWGFFSGYLVTRLFLASAFAAALAAAGDVAKYLQLKELKGKELESTGEYEKARTQFEQALRKVDATTPKDIKRRLYEGIIFNSLYQDPPGGAEKAIKYAQQFLTEEPQIQAPLVWAYLSFAYGQQYRYMLDNMPKFEFTGDDLQAVKTRAFEALKRALTIEPSLKRLAQMVWDPNDPSKTPGSEDNDLEVFKDDPDFKALLNSA